MVTGPATTERDSPALTGTLLAIGVVAVSFSAPLTASTAASALAVAFWRNALGALAVLSWALFRRRAELAMLLRDQPRDLLLCVLSGCALAAHFAAWLPSLRMTSVAASTALVTTAPVWTLILDRSGIRGCGVIWGVGCCIGGMVIIIGVDLGNSWGSSQALVGDALALSGGLVGAIYTVLGSRIRQRVSTVSYTAVAYSACALVLMPLWLLLEPPAQNFSTRTWLELLGITISAQLFGHTALNRAVKTAGPTVVSLVVLLEIPGAIFLAWIIWGQRPPPLTVPGVALLVLGLALVLDRGGARSRAKTQT